MYFQEEITLKKAKRGCHLITDEINNISDIKKIKVGLCHVHIKHTSASLAVNENWDPDVRTDMEMFLNRMCPESIPFKHSCEGPDDMPAHVKANLMGSSVTVPITDGKLNLGTWQGIWLCEHRDHGKLETTKLIYGGDSSVRGDGGGRGCEVRADSTYTIPKHKACKNCWHSKGARHVVVTLQGAPK